MDADNQPDDTPSAGDFPPGCAYVDGRFVGMAQASIPVLDWGLLRSDATYDVVHVWCGRFFRLDAHLDRFERSMASLRLSAGCTRAQIAAILAECVERSGLADAYVEMICTRGVSPTFSRDPRDAVNRFLAFAIPFGWILRPEDRAAGLHIAVARRQRIAPEAVDPTVKNYHWLDMVMGLFEGYEQGAESVVLTDGSGNVVEGPGFNLFVVREGRAATPGRGVLHGVTRQTAIELLAEMGVRSDVRPIPLAEVFGADEAFITSTAGGVMPVTRVGQSLIGDGRMGPLTARLVELYWQAHERPEWSIAVGEIDRRCLPVDAQADPLPGSPFRPA